MKFLLPLLLAGLQVADVMATGMTSAQWGAAEDTMKVMVLYKSAVMGFYKTVDLAQKVREGRCSFVKHQAPLSEAELEATDFKFEYDLGAASLTVICERSTGWDPSAGKEIFENYNCVDAGKGKMKDFEEYAETMSGDIMKSWGSELGCTDAEMHATLTPATFTMKGGAVKDTTCINKPATTVANNKEWCPCVKDMADTCGKCVDDRESLWACVPPNFWSVEGIAHELMNPDNVNCSVKILLALNGNPTIPATMPSGTTDTAKFIKTQADTHMFPGLIKFVGWMKTYRDVFKQERGHPPDDIFFKKLNTGSFCTKATDMTFSAVTHETMAADISEICGASDDRSKCGDPNSAAPTAAPNRRRLLGATTAAGANAETTTETHGGASPRRRRLVRTHNTNTARRLLGDDDGAGFPLTIDDTVVSMSMDSVQGALGQSFVPASKSPTPVPPTPVPPTPVPPTPAPAPEGSDPAPAPAPAPEGSGPAPAAGSAANADVEASIDAVKKEVDTILYAGLAGGGVVLILCILFACKAMHLLHKAAANGGAQGGGAANGAGSKGETQMNPLRNLSKGTPQV